MMKADSEKLTAIATRVKLLSPNRAAAVMRRIEMGKALVEAKSMVPHGEWLDYLDSIPVERSCAQRAMRIAERAPRTQATAICQALSETRI